MDASNLPSACLLAGAVGVASHLFYFRVGEHHMLGAVYVQLISLTCITAIAGLVNFSNYAISSALTTVLALALCWLCGVYSSLVVYRVLFHPLNKFPGPWQARVGDIWLSSRLGNLNANHVLHDLHQKYGRYVRIGSNTLSITDPDIMQLAYGPQSRVVKSDWYDAAYPHHSMQTIRDKGLHDRRRRVWAPAFSDKALKEYEIHVTKMNEKLEQRISDLKSEPINVSLWFNLYSFDIMGRLAFGKEYGMVDSGIRHWALDILTEGMKYGGFKLPTWLLRTLIAIPGAAAGHHKFLKFCSDELKWRVENGKGSGNDITGWLLKAYANETHPEDDAMLQGDSRLIIVAGSDTTAAALTFLFYHLASDPGQQRKLRDELRSSTHHGWTYRDIKYAKYLDGAINEALRLHPPVPSGVMRKTPAGGLQIGETVVPGNATFCTPQYPMGRDEQTYSNADSFIPERWYSEPDLVQHPDAFAPFSMGPFGCIGQNLARMEIRMLSTLLLLKYNVAFAPHEDGSRLLRETKDHFTLAPGQLDLVFTPVDD